MLKKIVKVGGPLRLQSLRSAWSWLCLWPAMRDATRTASSSIALGEITPLVADCQVVAAELVALAASLEGFSPAKAWLHGSEFTEMNECLDELSCEVEDGSL